MGGYDQNPHSNACSNSVSEGDRPWIILVEATTEHLPPSGSEVGIDVGITSVLTLSRPIPDLTDAGGKIANPRQERRERVALAKAQRSVVDRWLPSSRTCSACGRVKAVLSLSERVFRCEGCLVVLDRDINAARNILAAGRAVTAVEPKWDRPGTSR